MSPGLLSEQKPFRIPHTHVDLELSCKSTWKSFELAHVIYKTQTDLFYRLRVLYNIYTYIYSFLFVLFHINEWLLGYNEWKNHIEHHMIKLNLHFCPAEWNFVLFHQFSMYMSTLVLVSLINHVHDCVLKHAVFRFLTAWHPSIPFWCSEVLEFSSHPPARSPLCTHQREMASAGRNNGERERKLVKRCGILVTLTSFNTCSFSLRDIVASMKLECVKYFWTTIHQLPLFGDSLCCTTYHVT